MAPSRKRDAATSSAGGKALLKQWRPLHEWRRFGCISDSCYGQIFAQPAHEDKSWKCAGCGLQHHHACELPPEDGSLVCGRCVELKENWRRGWEQQQPTVQVVQATAVLGGGGGTKKEKGRRGPARVVPTHVHQVYKLRCSGCAAAPAHSLLSAGATWQAAKWRASRGSSGTAARASQKKLQICAGTCAAPIISTAIGAAHSATPISVPRRTWHGTAQAKPTPAPTWPALMMRCTASCCRT